AELRRRQSARSRAHGRGDASCGGGGVSRSRRRPHPAPPPCRSLEPGARAHRDMSLPQPPLLLITDSAQVHLPLLAVVTAALEAGCRWVSLREKALPAAHRAALLDRLVARASAHRALAMVHGDIAAAAKAGAGGIHLSRPAQVAEARTVLGIGCLVGVSAHDE